MKFFNDTIDIQLSFCALMTKSYPFNKTIDKETRARIDEACNSVFVNLAGVYIYESNAPDDVDSFILASPAGYVWVLSSEAARANVETLTYFLMQADADCMAFGPETCTDVTKLNVNDAQSDTEAV